MTDHADFLVEIGTEELPPRALVKLSEALADGIVSGLADANLDTGECHVYASPRRLAVHIESLALRQQDSSIQKRGPAVAAAFDADGNPSKAALGFAKSCGMEVADLDRMKTDKGEWLVVNIDQKGAAAKDLLPAIIAASLAALPIPKRMRWSDHDVEFVRPVHWLVILLGDEVVEASLLGLTAGRQTRGHRFHSSGELTIAHPADYVTVLREQGHVIADFDERRQLIAQGVTETAKQVGGHAVVDADLLDEVTALVEWPVAVAGNFDAEYLEIPSEVLITTMKDNQKYFPLLDNNGKLLPLFITISNIDSSDMEKVRVGNEVVIRPRLADAMFFWKQDRKKSLLDHEATLKNVVFQTRLGSIYDKTVRTGKLAMGIGAIVGADSVHVERAARLSKCDLMSEMVGEFPSVQGIMGEYYAELENEPAAVSQALREQYLPRYADDILAGSAVGQSLAIADRLDTLVGIFGIGQKPTGVKDPFALRRLSLGVLRTMIECELELDLQVLLKQAVTELGDRIEQPDTDVQVFDFMLERLRAYYSAQGIGPQIFDSVAAIRPTSPLDFDRRVKAVQAFSQLPEAQSLAAANKRTNNILKKNAAADGVSVDPKLFDTRTETDLHQAVAVAKTSVEPLFAAGEYAQALQALAQLREPIDQYFDEVMVMADDKAVRENRLAMLSDMRSLFSYVADLSVLQN